MYYGFLAIIKKVEDGMLDVTFPDFDELFCVEEKGDYTKSIKDALALHIIGMEDECVDIPKGMSATEYVEKHGPLANDEVMAFISFDSDEERKNITVEYETVEVEIPVWLRLLAEEKNVKLNKALEKGLKEILGLNR